MAKLTNAELQSQLDVKKWIDSEVKGTDTCGDYDYCSYCVKTEATPCAKAYNKANAKPVEKVAKSAAKTTTKTTKKTTAKKSK